MKNTERVKTILCYGDSNTWGAIPGAKHERFPRKDRWPGVLQHLLGNGYYVIEEGLSGRTTVLEDVFEEGRNGKQLLLPCLRTHKPIDFVLLMLGSNDLKARYAMTPFDISKAVGVLVTMIQQSQSGLNNRSPNILLIAPPPLGRLSDYAEEFEGGMEKSKKLGEYCALKARELACDFLDAGTILRSSDGDGVHLDATEHEKLAKAVADRIIGWSEKD